MWGVLNQGMRNLDQREGGVSRRARRCRSLSCQPEHEFLGTDPSLDHVLEPVANVFQPSFPQVYLHRPQ